MADLNVVNISGRLTADPELKTTQNGNSVLSFTVAVNRRAKAGEKAEADFINCVAWRKTAEFISKWFKKGQMIIVSGSLQIRSYEDPKSGERKFVTEVQANDAYFAGSSNSNNTVADTFSYQINDTDLFTPVGEGELPF